MYSVIYMGGMGRDIWEEWGVAYGRNGAWHMGGMGRVCSVRIRISENIYSVIYGRNGAWHMGGMGVPSHFWSTWLSSTNLLKLRTNSSWLDAYSRSSLSC